MNGLRWKRSLEEEANREIGEPRSAGWRGSWSKLVSWELWIM